MSNQTKAKINLLIKLSTIALQKKQYNYFDKLQLELRKTILENSKH